MGISVAISFFVVLSLFTLSGAMAWIRKRHTPEDYLIASRNVSPWLSALSAVSTNNSGFMFIAMVAFTYRNGLEGLWLVFGWILGDLTSWLLVHPKVRRLSEKTGVNTLPALLKFGKGRGDRALVAAAGMVVLVFLSIYAAAQLKASSTALNALFEWEMWIGVLIGSLIVILYSFAGGIRADIWTDAAQSFVMLATMVLILVASVSNIGGWEPLSQNLHQQDPSLLAFSPQGLTFGLPAYVLSVYFNGLGVIGQPHVMVRFFALESAKVIPRTGFWYFSWYLPFAVASLAVGLYARAIMPELPDLEIAQRMSEPTELALPLITKRLLPDIFVGVSLAGLFAATISTADSQIIVCSGSVTQDIVPSWKDSYLASKVATFSVTTFAVLVALFAPEGVFGLVLIAWSAMGASLGSLLVIRVFGLPITLPTAFAMILVSITTVTLWHIFTESEDLYEMLPGAVAALLTYLIGRIIERLWHRRSTSV